jgi:uncharacterized protein
MTAPNAPQPITHLLYLHGFRSSPKSTKAQHMASLMQERFAHVQWCCPQLPPSPQAAATLIHTLTQDWPAHSSAVIGSSLGGFYATWLAEQRGWRAVVINPAVFPARDLARHIGEQVAWHDPNTRFFFSHEYVDELHALDAGRLRQPHNYLALVAQGDEVLDWREMAHRYRDTQLQLLEGGDHALSDFERHLPQVLAFLGLR